MTSKPVIGDVMAHLDDVVSKTGLARALYVGGASRATAPANRWDRAAADLREAAESLAAAAAALEAMGKPEAYCTVCGQPILDLMPGWSHFTGEAERAELGHKPALDWREVGTPGKRTPLCTSCGVEPASDEDGFCWSCLEEGEEEFDAS